ncbi:hypothetical protein [Shewanella sp. SR44-3]|uniref:hypothetical protein n=1 Tax=Shewanella sp. SR44-3 TaxID=2760936 RepID=UPI0015FE597A|nr:hypothetical protein [Shewanella sp. SR44-3]MBB1270913.1 hypothetical protein [Shewanella sp. SR44-3]
MSNEIISTIEVLESGKLVICLASGGRPDYSNIYREGVGVYWNEELKGFISTEKKEWSYSEWFTHILKTAKGCGINCILQQTTSWVNFPDNEKSSILQRHAI